MNPDLSRVPVDALLRELGARVGASPVSSASAPAQALDRLCVNGCGTRVVVTTTLKGKKIVLEQCTDGEYVLVAGVAHFVEDGGSHTFHFDRCSKNGDWYGRQNQGGGQPG